MASAAGRPAAAAGSREVLAFDLYGTLVDPIAISSELSRLPGDRDGLVQAVTRRVPARGRRRSRPIGQLRLVTGNAFDCVGASAAGMRTAWGNRTAAPFDTIGAQPDLTVPVLGRLPAALAG
jgi:hypothetical protein